MKPEELLKYATEFSFYPAGAESDEVNGQHHRITVTERSPGQWAVVHMGRCWDGKEWAYEPSPSNRTKTFKKKTRFPLEKAVAIAQSQIDCLKVNGRTYSEWVSYFASR